MVKINIYGCGISGLTIAHELIEKGFDIEIYEKKSIAGGMARTFRYNNGVPTEHSCFILFVSYLIYIYKLTR